jgi:hypothetical protein
MDNKPLKYHAKVALFEQNKRLLGGGNTCAEKSCIEAFLLY